MVSHFDALLVGNILSLYQNNPFRVLNLATDATMKQARKQAQRLNVWRQMGEKVANEYDVRDALQILQNPQKRLLSELFWFHTDGFDLPDSANALAFERLKKGDWQKAREMWRKESLTNPDQESGHRALHNLAVLLHARVVTHEEGRTPLIKLLKGNNSLPEKHVQDWRESLSVWQKYINNDAAWRHWKARAFDIADKRMSTAFVQELREILPYALLQINRDLARRYMESNYGLAAGTHCQLMLNSGLDDNIARTFCRTVLDSYKKRIFHFCENLKQRLVPDRELPTNLSIFETLRAAEKFAATMRAVVAIVKQADPTEEFGAIAIQEHISQTLRDIAIYLANRKQHVQAQYENAIKVLLWAQEFAPSASLRNDLNDYSNQMKHQKAIWKESSTRCLLCTQRPESFTIYTDHKNNESRLAFLCKNHAYRGEEWEEIHLKPVVAERWNWLPKLPPDPKEVPLYMDDEYQLPY